MCKTSLTQQQTAWLVAHFKNTKNEVICAKLGITLSTMHRIKRALGLAKTRQFMRKMQANAVSCAQVAMTNETEEAKERRRLQGRVNGEKSRFKSGEYVLRNKSPEELAAIHSRKAKQWRETRRQDEVRLNWGYPQQTKFHFGRLKDREQNIKLCHLRHYLRKKGYEIPQRSGMVAYITDSTSRSTKCENLARQLGMIIRVK